MHLQICLFKHFQVTVGGSPIPSDKWRGSTPRSLLQYLATSRDLYRTADEIMEVFWSDSPLDNARPNLQAGVSRLRAVLRSSVPDEPAEKLVVFTGTGYRLPEDSSVDLWDFHYEAGELRRLAAQDPAAALRHLDHMVIPAPNQLLPDHPFADWAAEARKQAQNDIIYLYILRAELRTKCRHRHDALEDLRRVLTMDPTREPVAQLAMRLAAELGDRPAALDIFYRCRTALAEELGLDPTPELLSLHTQILREDMVAARLLPDDQDKTVPVVGTKVRSTNLPSNLSSFVGREDDLAEVSRLLCPEISGAHEQIPYRLVTLTGPGGCGKTRLALEIGRRLMNAFPDGVWLVELAELRDSTLLADTVAATFDLQGAPGQPAMEVVRTFLEMRRLLLILDNCEHLVEGCAQLSDQLLLSCPQLQILATSRQSLGRGGEVIWSVSHLPIPDPRTASTLEQFLQNPAARLFSDRARSVLPRFEITAETAAYIATICRCLDGIPLAIELAAARVRLLPVREIVERLRARFQLLTHGMPFAAVRHQTLRNTLDWSYDLLTEEERTLFRRLSVFAGGFGLEAAEAICAGPDLEPARVLDLLHALVDKSLVIAELQSFPARFRLLETIREYGVERLEEAGETRATWHRNLLWWQSLAAGAEPHMLTAEQVLWYNRLDADLDNLRVTLHWANQSGETLLGLQTALSLWRFWVARNHSPEGARWLDLFLARSRPEAPLELQAKALTLLAGMCLHYGDAPKGCNFASEACTAAQSTQDPLLQAQSIGLLGTASLFLGDAAAAMERLQTSLALGERIGNDWLTAEASQWLGVLSWMRQDLDSAEAYLNRAHEGFSKWNDLWNLALSSSFLARIFVNLREFGRARDFHRETLSLYTHLRDKRSLASALTNLARVAMDKGNPGKAVRLIGVVDALIERSGATVATWIDWVSWLRHEYHQVATWGRSVLTPDEHREAYTTGWSVSLEEAIADALSD